MVGFRDTVSVSDEIYSRVGPKPPPPSSTTVSLLLPSSGDINTTPSTATTTPTFSSCATLTTTSPPFSSDTALTTSTVSSSILQSISNLLENLSVSTTKTNCPEGEREGGKTNFISPEWRRDRGKTEFTSPEWRREGEKTKTKSSVHINVVMTYNSNNRQLDAPPHPYTGKDLISNLPNYLRLHILSFLPARDAIQTTCLSKRWLHLWIWLPQLSFSSSSFSSSPQLFVDFVNRSLFFHTCCGLINLSVHFGDNYAPMFNKDITAWLQFVIKANVQELVLDLTNNEAGKKYDYELVKTDDRYELPQELYYRGSSITTLSLSSCYINPNPNQLVNWNSLKFLSLRLAKMSQDAIHQIISGSPSLDTLELSHFSSVITRLEITGHAHLRKLVLGAFKDPWNPQDRSYLHIIAPTIVSLEISGCMGHRKCKLIDVCNVIDCALKMEYVDSDLCSDIASDFAQMINLQIILRSLIRVKNLTLGRECMVVLLIHAFYECRVPICKQTCLVLEIHHVDRTCRGIKNILQSSPLMETLIINIKRTDTSLRADDRFIELAQQHWEKWQCLLPRLKTIKINGFYDKFSMPFVCVLLRDASVLEKMIIKVEKGFEGYELRRKKNTLISLPRASQNAVISFC